MTAKRIEPIFVYCSSNAIIILKNAILDIERDNITRPTQWYATMKWSDGKWKVS